jgi:L-alanine-DL-glutamate epimerase-like enolase superfamily enzyme
MIKKGDTLVLDVRDAPRVATSGKVAGAANVCRGMLEFRADPESLYHDKNFDRDKSVILYCASGGRSALALGYRGQGPNMPLCRLLGGGVADLASCASMVRYSDPCLVRTSVREAIDTRFGTLKLHEIDISAIRAAREEAGPDIELMLDVN